MIVLQAFDQQRCPDELSVGPVRIFSRWYMFAASKRVALLHQFEASAR